MLNYSWKASPNGWGRPDFNASFSIGFGNGLSALHYSPLSSCRDDDQWPAHQPEPAFEGLGV